jgi:hypothetical protein
MTDTTNTNTLVPSIDWRKNTTHSIHQIFNCSLNENTLSVLHLSLVESSFFLPPEVLSNKNYLISPITVLGQKEFGELVEWLSNYEDWKLRSDVDYLLLSHAKNVGVSLRVNQLTNRVYMVCKLWYGDNPMKTLSTDSDTKYLKRVEKLYRFINPNWKAKK